MDCRQATGHLPEPMMIQIYSEYVAIWRHYATMSWVDFSSEKATLRQFMMYLLKFN